MSDRTVIATVPKNQREEIQVALDSFKGIDLLDVRVFAAFDDDSERKATKKGISVKVDRVGALIAALTDADIEARRQGLL